MASLDSTERAKVALAAGESLIVTTTGQCTVQGLSGAPATTTTLTANTQTFGPYGVSAVLLVTNVSGRTEYAANNATFQLNRTEKAAFDSLVSGAGVGPLSISAPDGTAAGDVLTATPNTGWTVASYQWTRDGVDINGATSSTYTLTLADEGALIGCRAGAPVYSALIEIPAGAYPAGYLSLDGGAVSLDGGVLSIV